MGNIYMYRTVLFTNTFLNFIQSWAPEINYKSNNLSHQTADTRIDDKLSTYYKKAGH